MEEWQRVEMVWGGGFRRSQAANSVTTAAGGGQTVDSGISIFRPFCRDSPRLCQVLPNPHPLRAQDKDFIVHSRIHYTSFDISTPLHRSTSSLAPPRPPARSPLAAATVALCKDPARLEARAPTAAGKPFGAKSRGTARRS